MIHAAATFMPRPRPADHVVHLLVAAHRSAWGEYVRSGFDDKVSEADSEALVRALAICPARSESALAAKASVIEQVMSDTPLEDLIGDDSSDLRLVLSFARDALTLAAA
jgi:hypothetical protein